MVRNAQGTGARRWTAIGRRGALVAGLALAVACSGPDAATGRADVTSTSSSPADATTTTSSSPPVTTTTSTTPPSTDVRPTKTSAVTPVLSTSTVAASVPPDGGCDTAVELLTGIGAARERESAAAQLDALGAAIDLARPALAAAEPATRELVEGLVAFAEEMRRAGLDALEDARSTGDPVTEVLTDRLITLFHQAVLNPLAVVVWFEDLDVCPALREVGGAGDIVTAGDPTADIRATVDELVANGHGDIADGYLPEGWLDLTERDMSIALSGMQADYDRCAIDLQATAYGDNAGCDALHDACDARDLLACNDLYWASVVSSDYEQFAATCGDRTPIASPASAGYCEQLG